MKTLYLDSGEAENLLDILNRYFSDSNILIDTNASMHILCSEEVLDSIAYSLSNLDTEIEGMPINERESDNLRKLRVWADELYSLVDDEENKLISIDLLDRIIDELDEDDNNDST